MAMLKYKRVLLKLSGESLAGEAGQGIDPERLSGYISQVNEITGMGAEVGIVIGGGNIFRGISGMEDGFDRVKGDYMGMLATVINGLALQSAFEKSGIFRRPSRGGSCQSCSARGSVAPNLFQKVQLPQRYVTAHAPVGGNASSRWEKYFENTPHGCPPTRRAARQHTLY